MKRIITFTKNDFKTARKHLLQNDREEAAFFLAGFSKSKTSLNLLVREIIPVPKSGFIERRRAFLKIEPNFMMPLIKRARLNNFSIISAHSHPFCYSKVTFSSIDDYGDSLLMPKIQQRVPDRPHATMVFGKASIDASIWENGAESKPVDLIKVVGRPLREVHPTSSSNPENRALSEMHNRQILAFGEDGQKRIQRQKVAIVGLGGTGSQVFQQLVHLGVESFLLIDNDYVKESNRSRIVGSRPDDAISRKMKTEVMERLGKEINPEIETKSVTGSVNILHVVERLKDVDVIFCCTDNLSSRLVLNRVAYQYLIPMIDLGIDIQTSRKGEIRTAGGRVMVILPDQPCLYCLGILKPEALLKETNQTGYITGQNIPDPSVITLNGVISSLATTEFIDLLTGFERRKSEHTYQIYDILRGEIWREKMQVTNPCGVCREVRALGDNEKLPCQQGSKKHTRR
jgi:molybdopterin/thiamine biosynthesis adenylyltransferase